MKKLFHTLSLGLIVSVMLLLAACGGSTSGGSSTSSGGNSSSSSGGGSLNIAFLPKAVNNPYFDTAANGGKDAAKALGGTFKQVGPSDASAAAQELPCSVTVFGGGSTEAAPM